jgi:hypothetical protein
MLQTIRLFISLLVHQDVVPSNSWFFFVDIDPPKVRVPHGERVDFPNLCAPLVADPSHDDASVPIFMPSDHHLPVQQLQMQIGGVSRHPREILQRAAKNLNKISIGHDLNFQLTLICRSTFCAPLSGAYTSFTPALIWAGIKPEFFT